MLNVEEIKTGLPPDLTNQFYDLRALAMNARSLTYTVSESMEGDSDELNAVRRVLKLLEDKALEFANQADEFLMSFPDTQTAGGKP